MYLTPTKILLESFTVTNQSLNICFLKVLEVAKTIKRKKNTETVKEELLKLLEENCPVEESDFDIKNTVNPIEAINKTNPYDKIIQIGNKNTIRYESIHRQILKQFKYNEGFVENVKITRYTVYLKIGLYNIFKNTWF